MMHLFTEKLEPSANVIDLRDAVIMLPDALDVYFWRSFASGFLIATAVCILMVLVLTKVSGVRP